MAKIARFLRLPGRDRALLLQAVFFLTIVKLGLAIVPLQTLHHWLTQKFPPTRSPQAIPTEKVLWAISIASRYFPGGAKCLCRALTARALLARQGYPARVRIGVAKDARGQLEAHAWLEAGQEILVGRLPDGDRFIPFADLEL